MATAFTALSTRPWNTRPPSPLPPPSFPTIIACKGPGAEACNSTRLGYGDFSDCREQNPRAFDLGASFMKTMWIPPALLCNQFSTCMARSSKSIVSAIVVRESCNPVVGDGGLLGAGDTVEGARPEKGEMNWVRAHALLALAPEKTRPAWSRFLWGVKGATDYGTGGRATWHGYSIAGDSGKCHLWGGLIYVDFCDSHSLHGGIPHPIPAFPTLTYPLPLPRLRNSDVRPFHLPPPPLPHPHPILAAFYLCKDQLHGQRAPRNWAREGEVETCLPHAHGRTGP
ncbi:hypothetical protein FA13DRAFT_1708113 [Coprinellus micaceus]|uniref:Uncharacterized protein n=1 Tax=Coprinellus micaceus TaxID=71717 RepID=A0A4Y7TKB6_COPMI|nr:hypothetical protein FA13DRAFT_1708113 [Coprinellus micaceus]